MSDPGTAPPEDHDNVAAAESAADADCIFCDIVAGTAPASVVHEDERIIAFLDIRPVTLGHLLVIPRRHYAELGELPAELGADMFGVAHTLAGAVRRSGLRCEGVNMFLADGEAAGQEVFHVHLHVFPRFRGDGFVLEAGWESVERADLDSIAAKLRAAAEENRG